MLRVSDGASKPPTNSSRDAIVESKCDCNERRSWAPLCGSVILWSGDKAESVAIPVK